MPLLFAYGTLAPLDEDAARREGWEADAVRGRLYDLGPYPGLFDHDDPESGWVEGHVREISWAQITDTLDPYEGVDSGPFRRVSVRTRGGREVWVYVHADALPPTAHGPIDRWKSTKRVRLLSHPENP